VSTLSVCVIARDEEDRLPACLDSVAFADEIVVVVDSRSRDGTEQVALERADIVEMKPYLGNIEQTRHCVGLAKSEWVLVLDADERVPRGLATEVGQQIEGIEGIEGADGFEVNRITHHLGRWIRHGDFHPDWTLRLFRPAKVRWTGQNPHGRIVVAGRVGRLRGALEHYSYRDLADQIERIQDYSREEARAMHAAGRRARWHDLSLRPLARFLRAYLLKRGFLDGLPGFVIAAATAFHVLLKYAKLWELERTTRRA
jgi:glycosyltransferase involved in cell wall biosynthesis